MLPLCDVLPVPPCCLMSVTALQPRLLCTRHCAVHCATSPAWEHRESPSLPFHNPSTMLRGPLAPCRPQRLSFTAPCTCCSLTLPPAPPSPPRVLHRDLKTSNILYNNKGELKICDFGMARQFGSPLGRYTQLVSAPRYSLR